MAKHAVQSGSGSQQDLDNAATALEIAKLRFKSIALNRKAEVRRASKQDPNRVSVGGGRK